MTTIPHRLARWGIFAFALVCLSALVFRDLVADLDGAVYAHNDDTSLFIWWFANAADSLAGLAGLGSGDTGLLYTRLMNAPTGVNGAWNTSVLGLAIPMAPLTWAFGPVVSFNLAIIASPVCAALACAALLVRLVDRAPALIAATAYGFSPYLIAQAGGHLNLSFAVLPPLVVLGCLHLLTLPRGRVRDAVAVGAVTGGAVGWQMYISSELLAGTFLAVVVLVVLVAVQMPQLVLRRIRTLAAGAAALLVTALLLAAPLFTAMATAPGAPRAAIRPHGVWSNDVLDLISPPLFTTTPGLHIEIPRVMHLDPAEIGGYVSLAWLVLAVLVVVAHRRSVCFGLVTRTAGLWALLVWLLSMGAALRVGGTELPWPGPFALVERTPVLENILPMRMSVHVVLALSALMAVGLHSALRSLSAGRTVRAEMRRSGAVLALTALTFASIAPVRVEGRPLTVPDFYAEGAGEIPSGALVKTLPRPIALAEPDADQAMVWQAVTGMRYRETGGYFIGSTETSPVIYQAPDDALDRVLSEYGGAAPAPEDPALGAALAELADAGVDAVVIADDVPRGPERASELAQALAASAGLRAETFGGVHIIDLSPLRG